jgi:hypothetical protein
MAHSWASAATSMLRSLTTAGSAVCHVTVGHGLTRLRCLIVGHDDSFNREVGRLSLRCDECGRTTAGWMIGAAGPRVVSRLPRLSSSTVATGPEAIGTRRGRRRRSPVVLVGSWKYDRRLPSGGEREIAVATPPRT